LTEHSGRFGKFGFLADQAKFPPSHGSRPSTIGWLRLFPVSLAITVAS
jgi:hypothetical protein